MRRAALSVGVVASVCVCGAAPDEPRAPASPAAPAQKSTPSVEPGHEPAAPACAYPHPLISEVFFAVPTTGEFDANRDGKREVSGDEFIELVNPHERPIELRGYTLTDGSPSTKTQLRFAFPATTVPAHGVVVVFNGHDSKIPGPVGDSRKAPGGTNEQFGRALVFAVNPTSSRSSFSNAGDAACLRAPDGKLLQRVRWGKADDKAGGTGFVLDEIAPTTTKASVQRDGIGKDARWRVHTDVETGAFSPGVFAPAAPIKPSEKTDVPAAPSVTQPPASKP